MIQACLACPKEKCTGECNRIYALKIIDSGERYECFGHRYSVPDIVNLTGRMYRTVLNAARKGNPTQLEKLLKPTYLKSQKPKIYEHLGLKLRASDWANLLGITHYQFVWRATKGETASEIVLSLNAEKDLQADKFEIAFISAGKVHDISHYYTYFEIYTEESMEDAVRWVFECLRFKKVPERDEWLRTINKRKNEMSSEYYTNGYYQVFRESHGFSLYLVEPCEN